MEFPTYYWLYETVQQDAFGNVINMAEFANKIYVGTTTIFSYVWHTVYSFKIYFLKKSFGLCKKKTFIR